MRISDWSSDVCSSDLRGKCRCDPSVGAGPLWRDGGRCKGLYQRRRHISGRSGAAFHRALSPPPIGSLQGATADQSRSEEHTSELQSLMRISYAVFCLKKKNKKHQIDPITAHAVDKTHYVSK